MFKKQKGDQYWTKVSYEVRELGRGQIVESLRGHDNEFGFYPKGNAKP